MSTSETTNPRCIAITKQGDQCLNNARDGEVTCYVHRNYVVSPAEGVIAETLVLDTEDVAEVTEDFAAEMTEPVAEVYDDVSEIVEDAVEETASASAETIVNDTEFSRIASELLEPDIGIVREVVQLDPNDPVEEVEEIAADDTAGSGSKTSSSGPKINTGRRTSHSGAAPAGKDRGLALVLEVLGSVFGFMGLGWMYVGKVELGLAWLIGYWIATGALLVFDLITLGLGLCLHIPLAIGAWALSAVLLRRHMESNLDQFKS